MTERRGVVLTVLVGLALVAIAVISALSGGQVRRLAGEDEAPPSPPAVDAPTAVASPEPLPTLPPVAPGTGQDLGWILQALLVVAVVAAIVGILVLWRRLGRPARREREPADTSGEFAEELTAAEHASRAVRLGLVDLDAPGSDPRGVVIGCWLALERAAAAVGLARRDTDSPTDLVTRLLAGADVPAPVLGDLAALYRAARYAPDEVTESSRDAARHALTQVAEALERPPPDDDGGADQRRADTGREPAGTGP